MTDTANPLTVADNFDVEVSHHDLLSTVDYLIKQLGYRVGQPRFAIHPRAEK
jgi:hypothetical protein